MFIEFSIVVSALSLQLAALGLSAQLVHMLNEATKLSWLMKAG